MKGRPPFYVSVHGEDAIFQAAFRSGLAVVLRGPTGCGKTRFVEAMAYRLDRPLVTVSCHEDLTAADLVGRYLLEGGNTVWCDGPLTRAVKEGAICYLDEIVEARPDTAVVLHPLADHRRRLPIERLGITLDAAPGFGLVMSYNPGYQSVLKDLKESTRQRLVAIDFGFPPPEAEVEILCHESGVDPVQATRLVGLGDALRKIEPGLLREVASTRLLVSAAKLIHAGLAPHQAARAAVVTPLTDDPAIGEGLLEILDACIPRQEP